MTIPNLNRAGWRPEVYTGLQNLLLSAPQGEVAVFDFDNTCILGDIGELFSHYLIDEMKYRYDLEEYWELVDPLDGRDELRRVTEAAMSVDRAHRKGHELYERYLAEMGALYARRLFRAGKRDCYEWAVRLHVGIGVDEMFTWSKEAMEREIANQVAKERRQAQFGEVQINRGIRLIEEIGHLLKAMEDAGLEVWVVSATNHWTVQVAASFFGIPKDRVLGNRVALDGDRLTAIREEPVLFREGKVEIIEREIGKVPVFVAGDAITDLEMLGMATHLSLVIDRGDQILRKVGKEKGWLFQPQADLTHLNSPQKSLLEGQH